MKSVYDNHFLQTLFYQLLPPLRLISFSPFPYTANLLMFVLEKFECPMCGKYYTTKKSLKTHLTIDCQNQEQFHCPFCPQKLKHKRSMMRHINNVHSKQKNVTSDSMQISVIKLNKQVIYWVFFFYICSMLQFPRSNFNSTTCKMKKFTQSSN